MILAPCEIPFTDALEEFKAIALLKKVHMNELQRNMMAMAGI
jgi:hypothetical protein